MVAEGEVVASMVCSFAGGGPGGGVWSGVSRRRKARRRNRAGGQPAGFGRERCFSAGKRRSSADAVGTKTPASKKKILKGGGERSERRVALPTAPAKLTSRDTP